MACRLPSFRPAFILPDRRGPDVDRSDEQNDNSKQLIQSKMNEYRSRAEMLEQHLTWSKGSAVEEDGTAATSRSPSVDCLDVRHSTTPLPLVLTDAWISPD